MIDVDEARRVDAVERLQVIGEPPTNDMTDLVILAASIAGSEVASINLLDHERQWSVASTGREPGWVPREDGICQHVVRSGEPLSIADAIEEGFETSPHVDGRIASLRMYSGYPLTNDTGEVLGALCVWDSTARRLTEIEEGQLAILARVAGTMLETHRLAREWSNKALHDELTGVPNRTLVRDRITHALERRYREVWQPFVAVIDVNGFKHVNDAYGHAAGDDVLRQVAARLCQATRPEDTIARYGGDEFVVLVDMPVTPAVIESIRQRIGAALKEPLEINGRPARVSASVGTADGRDGSTVDELLAVADQRMYADKRRNRGEIRR